mmetsp:Transcript_2036/g.5383  ORF Transcript_2036/g.5383 Transcript_2036/m.5383 type:complete len:268 (-) Transcript_2036:1022-1825(-)
MQGLDPRRSPARRRLSRLGHPTGKPMGPAARERSRGRRSEQRSPPQARQDGLLRRSSQMPAGSDRGIGFYQGDAQQLVHAHLRMVLVVANQRVEVPGTRHLHPAHALPRGDGDLSDLPLRRKIPRLPLRGQETGSPPDELHDVHVPVRDLRLLQERKTGQHQPPRGLEEHSRPVRVREEETRHVPQRGVAEIAGTRRNRKALPLSRPGNRGGGALFLRPRAEAGGIRPARGGLHRGREHLRDDHQQEVEQQQQQQQQQQRGGTRRYG